MKKLSLILNAILLVAVVVLYVLFFTSKNKPASASTSANESSVPVSQDGIVYINIDSVLNSYDMYFDLQSDLQEKLKTSEAQLMSKEKSLRKEMEDFQYKVERGLITRAEAGELQQELAQKEQALYQFQNNLQLQLAEEEQVAQRNVLNSIMEYLNGLEDSGEYNYQFVLGTTFGGNILYANKNMNISKAVVEGLNADYIKNKE